MPPPHQMSKVYAMSATTRALIIAIIAIDAIDAGPADLSRTATRSTRSRNSCTANSYRRPDSLTSSRSPLTGTLDTMPVGHAWTVSRQRPSFGLRGRALVRAGGRKWPQSSGKRWVSDPVYASTMAPRQIRESMTGACQNDSRTVDPTLCRVLLPVTAAKPAFEKEDKATMRALYREAERHGAADVRVADAR